MPDLDTDPALMRQQQDKDTPEHIDADETSAPHDESDTDPASAEDRKASKAGRESYDDEQQTAIFKENAKAGKGEAGHGQTDVELASNQRRSETDDAGLAGKGRSRLGK